MRLWIPVSLILLILLVWFPAQMTVNAENAEQDVLTTDFFLSTKLYSPIPLPIENKYFQKLDSWNTQDGRYEVYQGCNSSEQHLVFVPKLICHCRGCLWK